MRIENISIDKIIPYAQNNRTHSEEQVAQIAKSIKEYGFVQPVVVDKANSLIIGHGRLMAASLLGIDTIPALRLENLTEAKLKALRIIDNKLGNSSTWNIENLESELSELEGLDYDLQEFELDAILPEFDDAEGFASIENDEDKTESHKLCPHCKKPI